MKKNNIILGIAIIIFIVLITVLIINKKNTAPIGNLEEITYKQIQTKIDKKEDFIIVLSQTTCSHCAEYKPILKKVAEKYNLTIYYLDYDKYEKETQNEIIKLFNFDGGTPTTFFYKKGKEKSVMNRLVGTVSEDKVIKTLTKLEYIKETE